MDRGPICLSSISAMSGTGLAYGAMLDLRDVRYSPTAHAFDTTSLRLPYAMSGTDLQYGATSATYKATPASTRYDPPPLGPTA
eukprot:2090831-Rhodomonas_salina.2